MLFSRLADNGSDGNVANLHPDILEEWAGWTGEAGAFDAAFRASFVTDGVIDGWEERQGKLIARQQADRDRKRAERRRKFQRTSSGRPADAPRDIRVTSGCNEDDNGNGITTSSSSPAAACESTPAEKTAAPDAPLSLIVAANQGMRDNPLIGNGAELLHPISHGHPASCQVAADLLREVDADFARGVIYEMARDYQPASRGAQIKSLRYFAAAVRERWSEREAERAAGARASPRGGSGRAGRGSRTISERAFVTTMNAIHDL